MPSPAPANSSANKPVIIIGASARALAASATAAGYAVYALDLFADTDTREHCHDCLAVRGTLAGFDAGDLIGKLKLLDPDALMPVVYSSVIDLQPELLATIFQNRKVHGTQPHSLRRLYDPLARYRVLMRLGIQQPETRECRPAETAGWIQKSVTGSGGLHIDYCVAPPEYVNCHRVYFQRLLNGRSLSVTALACQNDAVLIGYADQSPDLNEHPFRFAGACALSAAGLSAALKDDIRTIIKKVSAEFELRGLVSFDFIEDGNGCWLLEVNARPSANFELHDIDGMLFKAHVEASNAIAPSDNPVSVIDRGVYRGFRVIYASRSTTLGQTVRWPAWAKDRAHPGTRLRQGEPLCTVHASAGSERDVRLLLEDRIASFNAALEEPESTILH